MACRKTVFVTDQVQGPNIFQELNPPRAIKKRTKEQIYNFSGLSKESRLNQSICQKTGIFLDESRERSTGKKRFPEKSQNDITKSLTNFNSCSSDHQIKGKGRYFIDFMQQGNNQSSSLKTRDQQIRTFHTKADIASQPRESMQSILQQSDSNIYKAATVRQPQPVPYLSSQSVKNSLTYEFLDQGNENARKSSISINNVSNNIKQALNHQDLTQITNIDISIKNNQNVFNKYKYQPRRTNYISKYGLA